MPHVIAIVVVLVGLLAWSPTEAEQMSRPRVEYSANATIENEEGTMRQKVFVTPTKERKETLTGAGEGAVQIFRFDKMVMWMLMPSQSIYMEHAIGGGSSRGDDPSQWTYEHTVVGAETLNGMQVTKHKTIATSTDGKKYGGFTWQTADGITIKQDLLYKEGKKTKRMLTELSNLEIGRQDPKLFEIPAGFTKFSMGGMMQGAMGREGMDQRGIPGARPHTGRPPVTMPSPDDEPAPEPEAPADEQSGAQKAGELLKGIFGR